MISSADNSNSLPTSTSTLALTEEELAYLQSLPASDCRLILSEMAKSKGIAISSKDPRGGHNRKSDETHWQQGTWRSDRHAVPLQPIVRPPCPPRPAIEYVSDIPIPFDDLIEAHYDLSVESALHHIQSDLSIDEAKRWAWDASDELAIRNGCRFDLKRAMHFAYTCRNCFLVWEGRHAGDPFILRTWQPEFLLRTFGWIRPDPVLGWVRRFMKASVWVPKKSGKTPAAAAVGNYLWRFDGVWSDRGTFHKTQGQHVYSMARNGEQAKLVHRNAYLMATNSPTIKNEFLTKECTFHKTTHTLTHHPSNSTYEKLSGDGPRSQKAGEGLNAGGIICDEAHVVDQNMVDITTDAGAAADQFLWFQISTAGAGDGYGKRDKEYGERVARGEVEDDAYLYRNYGAPHDLKAKDAGNIEIWKAANPAWGFTVVPRQFEASYLKAKDNPSAMAGFMRRRLNVWQEADSPMISSMAWARCGSDTLTLDDFHGQAIAAGVDLAAVGDFCAYVMVFQGADDIYRIWPKFWVADTFEKKYHDRTPVLSWTDADIEIHPGEVRLAAVEEYIQQSIHEMGVEVVGYDQMFAEQMAQNLRTSTGCNVVKYPQTLRAYSNASSLFLNALSNDRIAHPKHPVLDWMAGHVQCHERNGMQKPMRSDDSPWNKIDGIQAMLMAIDCVHYVAASVSTAYDDKGSLFL